MFIGLHFLEQLNGHRLSIFSSVLIHILFLVFVLIQKLDLEYHAG